MLKRCKKCGESYPNSVEYFRRKGNSLAPVCKTCRKKEDTLYRKKNRRAIRARKRIRTPWTNYISFENRMCTKYGITVQEYTDLMDQQKGCCDICGSSLIDPDSNRICATDHCHTTGKVRSLLCHNCNILIGACKENEGNLLEAILYLRKHRD